MAITKIEYALVRKLREVGGLPLGGRILEIGESNWYGDLDVSILDNHISEFAEISEVDKLRGQLREIGEHKRKLFMYAKIWFKTFFHAEPALSIDQNGPNSLKLDLNYPHKLGECFDIVINFGTGEHIFNIYQLYKSIHEWTGPSGLMIHGQPMSGFYNHGFYNFNPTFYFDLMRYNKYKNLLTVNVDTSEQNIKLTQLYSYEDAIRAFTSDTMPKKSLVYSFMQKTSVDSNFIIPQQGVYDASYKTKLEKEAWGNNRGFSTEKISDC